MNIEKVLRINFLKEHLRTAASEGSVYVKKINYHLFRIKIQTEKREKYICKFLSLVFF